MKPIQFAIMCLLASSVTACGDEVVGFRGTDGAASGDARVSDAVAPDGGSDGGEDQGSPEDMAVIEDLAVIEDMAVIDDIAPTVLRTNPERDAIGVALNADVTVTFSEPMDGTAVIEAFQVLDGQAAVPGAVRVAGAQATFQPTANLAPDHLYTGVVSVAATDRAGNPLALEQRWDFTTHSENLRVVGPNLGTLSTFVAVAGAGLTNSNDENQTRLGGDVGLFPLVTCLGDGEPCTLLNPRIEGTLYAADPEGVAARAKVDLTAAFVDAMGRPVGTVVDQLAGLTLPPGVYTAATSLDVAVGGMVTLDGQGDANAVWIFQVGSALTVNATASVLLINGAQAGNVYWAAGSSATVGTGADFRGNILASESLSLGTGATVEGRLLCSTDQITFLGNRVILPTR